ncbi:MAG: amidohydrolase [Sphaerobacteraceae bacterium]|nr:MAG: amidohydrolase [Sphaerobacteraceae bacterium]
MAKRSEEKQFALDWIDENQQRLSDFDMEIWNYHEPAWREYKSAKAYCDLLEKEGFEVERGSGEMPTAFVATFSNGDGPVLGAYAEYDAVPGNSQQAVPYKAPREGVHPSAAGHTDPHSMLGVAELAGVLAAKEAMKKHNLKGTLKFFGEPAEKLCGSKPIHAAKGYYDGFDAFIAYHPWPLNTCEWETHFGAYWSAVFTFETPDPDNWLDMSLLPAEAGPRAAPRAPGAVDAVCLMYTNTKYTKEAMFTNNGGWTLNEFILTAGDATADNRPPRFSQIQYAWRSSSLGLQEQIYQVLKNNAKAAAQAAGCTVSVRWVAKTRVGLPNKALADLTYRNLELVGPPVLSEEARQFGREIQKNLGLEPMDNPFPDELEKLTTPQDYEASVRRNIPAWQTHMGADDYVEYQWHAPTVRLLTGRPRLKSPDPNYVYPAWATLALGGVPSVVDPGMFVAGKTIAATLVDLLTEPEELARMKEEFEERTGGGVGGDKWVGPLLEKDYAPPIELRWPEYVTTERGEEWTVPTVDSDHGYEQI